MSRPELFRPIRLDRIGPDESKHELVATSEECDALARRFDIPAIGSLTCRFGLRRGPGQSVLGVGHLQARVTRICVATLEPFEMSVKEDFRLRFVPEAMLAEVIDPEADDEVPYTGETIDLGEAAAQQLALALDPYPRRPGAEVSETMPEMTRRQLGDVLKFRRH